MKNQLENGHAKYTNMTNANMTNANCEVAIRSIIEARANAARAGDVDAIMADVADDAVVFDVVDPMCREGKASSRERATAWVASYDGPISWENHDVQVMANNDVAFTHAQPRDWNLAVN